MHEMAETKGDKRFAEARIHRMPARRLARDTCSKSLSARLNCKVRTKHCVLLRRPQGHMHRRRMRQYGRGRLNCERCNIS